MMIFYLEYRGMVDKIQKALNKLSAKERKKIKKVLQDVSKGNLTTYNIKKLKGRKDIYRIRAGNIRIIFRVDSDHDTYLLAVERRSDTTYNF